MIAHFSPSAPPLQSGFRLGVLCALLLVMGITLRADTLAGRGSTLHLKWLNSSYDWRGVTSHGANKFIAWGQRGTTAVGAVAISSDDGETWSVTYYSNMGSFANIAAATFGGQTRFYATFEYDSFHYATSTDGVSWTRVAFPQGSASYIHMVCRAGGARFFRSVSVSGNGLLSDVAEYSDDGGQSWLRTNYAKGNSDYFTSVWSAPVGLGQSTVYFAPSVLNRLFTSEDGLNFGSYFSLGISVPRVFANFRMTSGSWRVYAAGTGRLYFTNNGTTLSSTSETVFDLAACFENDTTRMRLYKSGGDIYESLDDGATFSVVVDADGEPLSYPGALNMAADGNDLVAVLGSGAIYKASPATPRIDYSAQIRSLRRQIQRLRKKMRAASSATARAKYSRKIRKLSRKLAVYLDA